MNTRALYLAIGEISDDLILDADTPSAGAKRPSYLRWGALAACLLLVVSAIFLSHSDKDVVYFNSLTPPPPVGAKVQGDAEFLSYQEAMDYYGVTLPDVLCGLPRKEQALLAVYRLTDGSVSWDENRVEYGLGSRTVSISLSKAVPPSPDSNQGGKLSKLEGAPILLSFDGSTYWAELERSGTTLRIFAQGLCQTEFLDVVRAVLLS